MKISEHIDATDLCVAKLSSAYTLLAMASYDSWSHEGSPAEMAAYVIAQAKKEGKLSFVEDILLRNGNQRERYGIREG
jgi:hypothetical protein